MSSSSAPATGVVTTTPEVEEEKAPRKTAREGFPPAALVGWAVTVVGEANKRPVYAKDAAGNDTDVVVDLKRKVVQRRADATDAMQKAISEFALRLAVALHRETRGATMAATLPMPTPSAGVPLA